jgi:uncharacterized protein involved in exopolysaccharide biosynthesis
MMEDQHSRTQNRDSFQGLTLSMRDLVGIVFRRRRVIILSFAGLLAGALLAVKFLPPTYEAQMKILVERERVDPIVSTNANNSVADHGLTENEVTSEVELFQSRDSLQKAVEDCKLDQPDPHSFLGAVKSHVRSAFGIAPDKNGQTFKAILQLENDLHVNPINNSNLIKITYDSHSPQAAVQVLKELGDIYLSKHSEVHRLPGISEFFKQQADQYQKDLTSAENQLEGFNKQTGVVSADFGKQFTLQKAADFDISIRQTQAAIAETKQRLRGLEEQEANGSARVTTQIRTSENSELMASLKSTLLNLELKRTELLQRYDPTYPLVQEVNTQIAQTTSAIADAGRSGIREETTDEDPTHTLVTTEIAKAKADLMGLEARASAMTEALRTLQSKVLTLDHQSMIQQDLQRTVKSDEESFLLYQRKHEEARINDALDQRRIINAAIAEAAITPLTPVSLPLLTQLMLAVIVSGLSSLAIGFLCEYLDPSFRTPGEVQEYLDIPLLASFPKSGDQA